MEHNIEKIVDSVLVQNRIRNYNKKDLELQLQIHPNYPSFQSITDTLDYFDIDNIAVEVPIEALDQLPKSFVSLVKNDNGDEIVTVIRKDNEVELKHTNLKQKKYTNEAFKNIWVPKVIAVEYQAAQNLISNQSLLQNILIGLFMISVLYTFFNRAWSLNQALFLGTSALGMVFSIFAIRESLGYKSQTVHQFCTSVGKSSCEDVINNNSGTLLKNFSLADAGVLFFGSILLYQIFYGYTSALLIPVLDRSPLCSLFIIFSSICYKKMVCHLSGNGCGIAWLGSYSFNRSSYQF